MPSTMSELTPQLRARYGIAPVARWKVAAGVAVGAAVVGVGGYAGWKLVNPPLSWQVVAYDAVSPDLVHVTFQIDRPADRTAYCTLRAQDYNHHDVGYATVRIAPGTARVQGTYALATRTQAVAGEVLGCALDAPPVRVPAPAFPPGTVNPPQSPTFGGS